MKGAVHHIILKKDTSEINILYIFLFYLTSVHSIWKIIVLCSFCMLHSTFGQGSSSFNTFFLLEYFYAFVLQLLHHISHQSDYLKTS